MVIPFRILQQLQLMERDEAMEMLSHMISQRDARRAQPDDEDNDSDDSDSVDTDDIDTD